MATAILSTEKLCKTFSSGGVQQHVLKNLDITLQQGDFTVIMGASGSGKSTLLYALSGMDQPSLGDIRWDGESIRGLTHDQLAIFRRRHSGFVFQHIRLLDHMSVLDNVMASGLLVNRNRKEVAGRAKQLLTRVGLAEPAWHKFPAQLSGGEAQRVGIVRALINHPRIIFADEPTGALNSAASESVLDVLTGVHENGQTVILVTHDLQTALRGNRILYLRDGKIGGDLHLGVYQAEKRHERYAQLNGFLAEMGW